jgi:hypothetical protein
VCVCVCVCVCVRACECMRLVLWHNRLHDSESEGIGRVRSQFSQRVGYFLGPSLKIKLFRWWFIVVKQVPSHILQDGYPRLPNHQ